MDDASARLRRARWRPRRLPTASHQGARAPAAGSALRCPCAPTRRRSALRRAGGATRAPYVRECERCLYPGGPPRRGPATGAPRALAIGRRRCVPPTRARAARRAGGGRELGRSIARRRHRRMPRAVPRCFWRRARGGARTARSCFANRHARRSLSTAAAPAPAAARGAAASPFATRSRATARRGRGRRSRSTRRRVGGRVADARPRDAAVIAASVAGELARLRARTSAVVGNRRDAAALRIARRARAERGAAAGARAWRLARTIAPGAVAPCASMDSAVSAALTLAAFDRRSAALARAGACRGCHLRPHSSGRLLDRRAPARRRARPTRRRDWLAARKRGRLKRAAARPPASRRCGTSRG